VGAPDRPRHRVAARLFGGARLREQLPMSQGVIAIGRSSPIAHVSRKGQDGCRWLSTVGMSALGTARVSPGESHDRGTQHKPLTVAAERLRSRPAVRLRAPSSQPTP
jgi:hypothetical protein